MKQILATGYFIILVAVIISGTLDYEERPLLIIILSNVIFALVAMSVLLYGLSYKPKRFIWFWKIVPIVLVVYFISLRYLVGPSYVGTEGSLESLLLLILAIIAFFFPAFYLSFKFGYYKLLPAGKFNPIFIVFILVITSFCVGSRYFPLNKDRIKIKVDYVAKFNEISRPAGYNPNDNAAPYYQKAFELLLDTPDDIKELRELWPMNMNKTQLDSLKKWLDLNSEAISHLRTAAKKPYRWVEYRAENNFLMAMAMPDLGRVRAAAYCLTLQAKLMASQGKIEPALREIIDTYKIGPHFTGTKTLIEQLVGIAIKGLAVKVSFQILDNTEPSTELLENFQQELQKLSLKQDYIIDFTFDKLLVYDIIQRMFTDDGKNGGHVYGTRPSENPDSLESFLGLELTKEERESFEKLKRKETVKLTNKTYAYFNNVAKETPAQLHNEGKDPTKISEEMIKTNPLLKMLAPAFARLLEISYRGKVETDALITTIAIFRYKAEKGQLPENLDQLVVNSYLKELPIDPFSDKPLVYKRIGNDFILYSFAADSDDDGGARSKWGEGEKGGDQVFWPVEYPE